MFRWSAIIVTMFFVVGFGARTAFAQTSGEELVINHDQLKEGILIVPKGKYVEVPNVYMVFVVTPSKCNEDEARRETLRLFQRYQIWKGADATGWGSEDCATTLELLRLGPAKNSQPISTPTTKPALPTTTNTPVPPTVTKTTSATATPALIIQQENTKAQLTPTGDVRLDVTPKGENAID